MNRREAVTLLLICIVVFGAVLLSACGSDVEEEGGESSAFPTVVIPIKGVKTTTCDYEYNFDEQLVRSVCVEEQR